MELMGEMRRLSVVWSVTRWHLHAVLLRGSSVVVRMVAQVETAGAGLRRPWVAIAVSETDVVGEFVTHRPVVSVPQTCAHSRHYAG